MNATFRRSRRENPPPQVEGTETAPPPPAPGGRVLAIANQKGGVGKTTTAVNLSAALAELGRKILLVDLDPQGNASTGLGIEPDRRDVGIYRVISSGTPAESAVVETVVPGVWAIPSTIDLAGAEIELVSQFSRETRLARAIESLAPTYDFVILDCPPSLGLLTINALAAADELMVPIQCEYYALEGLGQLLRNVRLIQQNLNPDLRLSGIVLTMYNPRTRLSDQVMAEVRRYFGGRVYDSVIPRTVRLSEAPGFGQPITQYDPKSKGAEAYRAVARELLAREGMEGLDAPLPEADPPSVVAVPGAGQAREPDEGESDEDEETPAAPEEGRQGSPPQETGWTPPEPPAEEQGGWTAPESSVEDRPPATGHEDEPRDTERGGQT